MPRLRGLYGSDLNNTAGVVTFAGLYVPVSAI